MKRPDRTLMSLGMISLALANVSHWWVQRNGTVSPDLGDGVYGFGMGVAIALLLLAIKRGKPVDRHPQ